MAVVESLVKGKDSVVRGVNLRVIAKGKLCPHAYLQTCSKAVPN